MRFPALPALLSLTALACGGEDVDPGEEGRDPAGAAGPVGEDPGLPMDATEFRPSVGADDAIAAAIGGRLWITTAATVPEDGISLVAQLSGLPTDRAYSWGIHRDACAEPDDLLFGLGWGTVADVEGRGTEVANGGGPLGEMRLTFTPNVDGSAEETVFVPLGERLSAAELQAGEHSLRLHVNVEGEQPGPSLACAPLPAPPQPGEHDPEGAASDAG